MTTWPPQVWEAIDQLASLDLAHYPKHVFDREAFLGTARARRAEQHRSTIDALLAGDRDVTANTILRACNPQPLRQDPPEAARRDYDRVRVSCTTCDSVGRLAVVQGGVERWKPCPACCGGAA